MTDRIGIYIPTLGRAHKLKSLVDNIHETTSTPHVIVFVCEDEDGASIDVARKWGDKTYVNHDEASYSNCLQIAYEEDDSRYFIGANDDFRFMEGWDTEALKVMKRPGVQVVGIHDGNPSCNYSTISLVDREYIEEQSGVIDMPSRVNYPYHHNFVDTEFYSTAVYRGVFHPAYQARIQHIHPDFGHGQYDKTYNKSRSRFSDDSITFTSRAHLWTK